MKPVPPFKFLILLFVLASSLNAYGQGENNIWCFGYQHKLDFTAGPPVLGTSSILAGEGCASVCDAAGNLLFYSNSTQVWSRNNVLMPNGSGLMGSASTTQGVAMIQSYADPNKYYLFTMADMLINGNNPGQPTLFYSVIDMSLNAGYGDIVPGQKNIPLDTDVCEKMIVVKGAGCYNWLLVHRASSPVFHAFKVDAAGVAPQPVVSTSGFTYASNCYAVGEMKVSPDHQRIILTNYLAPNGPELHSFDNFTGVVSNAISLDTFSAYGLSYSPDGSKLYVGVSLNIYQYDMSLMPNITAVQNSRTVIFNGDMSRGMQIGPDNKVYVLTFANNGVSVINNPNLAGPACNFVLNAFPVIDYPDELGNQFVPNGQTGSSNNSHDTTACLFSPVTISGPPGYTNYAWSDGSTQVSDTITATGIKWVVATTSCSIRTDTFHVTVLPATTTSHVTDTTICFVNNIATLAGQTGYTTYLWNDGTATQNDTAGHPGTKWVQAQTAVGCAMYVDTFKLHAMPVTTTSSVTDTTACLVGNVPVLTATVTGTTYLWSDGKSTQTDTMSHAGTKWVQAQTGCTMHVDTFKLHAMPITTTSSVTDTTVCLVGNIPVLTATTTATTYLWSDGKTTQADTMSYAGTKWVQAQTGCNMHVDTFKLHAMPITSTSVVKDTNICFINNVATLSAPAGYTTYQWSDGKTTQTDTMGHAGTKWVQAQTGCNMVIDTFHAHDWRDTTKTSMDTTHCVAFSPISITAPAGYTSYLWSDGKVGQTDTFFSTTTKWVTALNGCNMLIDTVHFTANTVPPDSVTHYGGDTTICFEGVTSVNVNGPAGYTYYLWSDGVTTQTDVFTAPGTKWVYAQRLCYLLVDTFRVIAMPTDTTAGSMDTTVCFTEQVTLSATSGYDTYLWSDGNTSQNDTFTQNSIKQVYAHKACAERIDTFKVQFINDLTVDLGADTALCKGQSVTLDARSSYTTATYLWQDGKTNAVYNVTEGGDYIVKVSVGPCAVKDTIRVHEKIIDIKLGNGLIPCNGESIVLDPKAEGNYLWQDGSTNRTYTATREGTYTVKVTKDECSATASVTVRFEGCPCNVVLPTGFSPNNDNKNDKFGATISCEVKSYRLMIYNRWGNRVFYTENMNEKWDGTVKGIAVDGDVYNYYLEFKDGENKVYYYKGDITLVR